MSSGPVRTFVHPTGTVQQLAVADLLEDGGETISALTPGGAWLVYSDPPWNPGNEKWWRRHAGKAPPRAYNELLDAWCAIVARCNPEHVFCEQSFNDKHSKMFMDAIARCQGWRLDLIEKFRVYYGSPGSSGCRAPNLLLHFGREKISTDPTDMHGEAMTRRVFEGLQIPEQATVVDPCMGKGMTSRMGHRHAMRVVGTELNATRLAKTIVWIQKQGYRESQSTRENDLNRSVF